MENIVPFFVRLRSIERSIMNDVYIFRSQLILFNVRPHLMHDKRLHSSCYWWRSKCHIVHFITQFVQDIFNSVIVNPFHLLIQEMHKSIALRVLLISVWFLKSFSINEWVWDSRHHASGNKLKIGIWGIPEDWCCRYSLWVCYRVLFI